MLITLGTLRFNAWHRYENCSIRFYVHAIANFSQQFQSTCTILKSLILLTAIPVCRILIITVEISNILMLHAIFFRSCLCRL